MSISLPDVLTQDGHLMTLPNWVIWKTVIQDGEPKKIPLNPRTGKYASPTNPDTWASYETAIAAAVRMACTDNRTGGIGLMFGLEPCGYVGAGIDIDDCISPDGKISDMAADIIRTMNSYTEISPSGTGIHILFRLCTPLAEIGKRNRNDDIGLEIYDSRRYLTITGKVYGEPKPMGERTDELRQVYAKYMAKSEQPKEYKPELTPPPVDSQRTENNIQGTQSINSEYLTDSQLWEVMFNSKHGREIRALYNGDYSAYTVTRKDGNVHNDNSAADLALCSYLAWWTHSDVGRVDRMFRQSGLMRPKWNELHGTQTYGAMTIAKAMNNTYEPKGYSFCVQEYKPTVMTNKALPIELSTVGGVGIAQSHSHDTNIAVVPEWMPPMTSREYLSRLYHAELEQFQKSKPAFSGFENLDEKQGGFVPGMYVLGATPSLGKTTFMSQIADNMAKSGNFVLYFSLEQSRLEMVTKSLSRLTALTIQPDGSTQIETRNAVSSINIRRGKINGKEFTAAQRENVERAEKEYQKFSENIVIVELGFDATVSDVIEIVSGYVKHLGLRPIVIIDYLQILQPYGERQGSRDATETVIRALKRLQVDNSLVMFVISSFNRANYSTRVDYGSFKETGLVEYSADALFGMQPTVMATDNLFTQEKADKAQRAVIDKALDENPRKVMLKSLKNRYGRMRYSCGFIYDARFDLFVVDTMFENKKDDNDKRAII